MPYVNPPVTPLPPDCVFPVKQIHNKLGGTQNLRLVVTHETEPPLAACVYQLQAVKLNCDLIVTDLNTVQMRQKQIVSIVVLNHSYFFFLNTEI